MGLRQMPVALVRRFVLVQAVMNRSGTFCSCSAKSQVGRRRIDRVAAEDHQQLDPAALHVAGQGRAAIAVRSPGRASTGAM